jgi:ubiquinone/menaquinone biosynthesis C-methylase UbiE
MDALAIGLTERLSEALLGALADGASPEVALVRLLGVVPSLGALRAALEQCAEGGASKLARSVVRLIEADPNGAASVAEMLALERDRTSPAPGLEERIAAVARRFDLAVEKSEETSVAAYSLGSALRLERATAEVVGVLAEWGLLGRERVVLQIGCGIGRFEVELARRVRHAHGINVSARMIEVAKRRCRGLSNVSLHACSGRDLADFPDRGFDLVYAIDSFPYLFEAGEALVEAHVREARRVLAPGRDFVIFNLSYRGDLDADRRDVERWAMAHGLEVVRSGVRPLATWDGAGFHLRVPI